jgi:hypothetical protein
MSKKVRLLNKNTGKTIELDNGRLRFFTFLLNMRYWFVGLFTIGRPIMGLTGVALIVIAIIFGAVIDDGKGIAAFAAVVYISLGVYCSVNRNKMLIHYYLQNGWVQANSDSDVKARARGSEPVQRSGQAPTVTTSVATSISGTGGTFNGTVNPNGLTASVWFQWGTTIALGQSTTPGTITRTTAVPINSALSGALPNTTYYFRTAAQNSAGTNYGSTLSFTTSKSAPLAQQAPSADPVYVADADSVVPAPVPHPPLHLKEARIYVEPEKARAAVPHPPLHDRVPTPFPQAATKGAFCRDCGAPAGDSKFCPRCGQPQRPGNICSRCGTQLRVGSTFCAECGAKSA